MLVHNFRLSLVTGAIASVAGAAFAQSSAPADVPAGAAQEEIVVTAKRLDTARINIEPQIGASTYTITQQTIDAQPGGDNNAMNQVILQAPGVDQDTLDNGGLHVRNEHLNVQYRINGVILPDGVSFFGQTLSPRFVGSMKLITGALPAEYGLRTAGIIDIQSRSGLSEPGGDISLYGGSYGTFNPSIDYGGSSNGYTFFASLDYLDTDRGVEPPTTSNPIHDHSEQTHGFFYLDKIINDSSRISGMIGTFTSQFQIPNNPGQPTFGGISAINGTPVTAFNSANLSEHQTEGSQFGVLSYLYAGQDLDFQASAFTKFSDLHYHPDQLGDLAFNGVSQDAGRTSFANGFQGEGTYRLTDDHTVRFGVLVTAEHITSETTSLVLPQTGVDLSGDPIFGTRTRSLISDAEKTGWTYSAYLQDEWKILPTVTINFGGRFDVVNGYTEGNQVSPRINVVWQATPSTTVHAGYASYFTPPPLELVANQSLIPFKNTSAAPASTVNSPIKNEHAQYLDIGASQDVLPGLTIGLDLYYKYARNLLDEGQFGAPVILTPFNYNVGYNRGVELTTTYRSGNFSYYGNLAIAEQKAEGINSAQFSFDPADLLYASGHLINTDHSQRMTASAGMSYLWDGTLYSVDILAGTGLRTTNPGDNINEGTVPSYEQVNLGISHQFEDLLGGPTKVRFDVINLLDEEYLIRSSTGIGVFASQYAPARSFYAGVSKAF
jgi:outer membrane receptor protein involved in Fe transport